MSTKATADFTIPVVRTRPGQVLLTWKEPDGEGTILTKSGFTAKFRGAGQETTLQMVGDEYENGIAAVQWTGEQSQKLPERLASNLLITYIDSRGIYYDLVIPLVVTTP